jgi:hypothetical protein
VHGDATGTAVDDFAWHGWSATLARPTELIVSR